MSISAAMYAAITGLNTMGQSMSVISNNIANVNTIGFKSGRAEFVDLLSQRIASASGHSQVGRGVRMGSVNQVFSQGSFKNSSQDTDIAIGGEGFFIVRDSIADGTYYTRAGNFIFDSQGRLTTPTGHVLQGYPLDADGQADGGYEDIQLFETNIEAQVTTEAEWIFNLDADDVSKTDDVHLTARWDGSPDVVDNIDNEAYTYQTTLRVYDNLGGAHDLTVYFDPDDELDNKWDYIIACNPEEDYRTFDRLADNESDTASNTFQGTSFAGLLMRGTITFEPRDEVTGTGGYIREITADRFREGTPYITEDNTTMFNWNSGAATTTGPTFETVSLGGASVTGPGTYQGTNDATYTIMVQADGRATATMAPEAGTEVSVVADAGTYDLNVDRDYVIIVSSAAITSGSPTTHVPDGSTLNMASGVTISYGFNSGGTWVWNDTGPVSGFGPHSLGATGIDLNFDGTNGARVAVNQQIEVEAYVADLDGPHYPTFTWSKNGGAVSDPISMTKGLGPYEFSEGVQFSFERNATAPAGSANQIKDGTTFSIDCTANWESVNQVNNDGYFVLDTAFLTDPGPNPSDEVARTPVYQDIAINFGAHKLDLTDVTEPWTTEENTSTQYSAPSSTIFQTQDGYASGNLQSVSFERDGTLTVSYSNGRNIQPYRVALATFRNNWGLDKIGNNLYGDTLRSGTATINEPGQAGAGTISPNALEQSNVDLADEFVEMIVQQRGFQANSKVITTTDTMLAELINLKR